MAEERVGITPTEYNAILKDISKIYEQSLEDGTSDWNKAYSFKLHPSNKDQFTYKAYLERVIDGDTLLVTIYLGFKTSIEQRLRLRGLDAPELSTTKGFASKKFLESCLKDSKFLIIKTYNKDKYDHYLVDVFYFKNEQDEEIVLKSGNFLNKELLEGNYAYPV